MNFLNELNNFSKKKLKPTSTEISYLDGRKCILNKDEYEEIEVVDNSPEKPIGILGHVTDKYADLSIDKIADHLYLSGDDAATNRDLLSVNKITHIINITSNVLNKFEKELVYMKIHMYDLPVEEIEKYFKVTFEFIETALNASGENNVLVHCNQGISRSSAIVIAYLMQKKLFTTYKQAYEFVKQKRAKVMPNAGFIKKLLILEGQLMHN